MIVRIRNDDIRHRLTKFAFECENCFDRRNSSSNWRSFAFECENHLQNDDIRLLTWNSSSFDEFHSDSYIVQIKRLSFQWNDSLSFLLNDYRPNGTIFIVLIERLSFQWNDSLSFKSNDYCPNGTIFIVLIERLSS